MRNAIEAVQKDDVTKAITFTFNVERRKIYPLSPDDQEGLSIAQITLTPEETNDLKNFLLSDSTRVMSYPMFSFRKQKKT